MAMVPGTGWGAAFSPVRRAPSKTPRPTPRPDMSVHPETRRASATSRATRRRWASRRSLHAHMQASLTRMVANARRQLPPLCGCGGGRGAIANPTAWDQGRGSAATPKLPKAGLVLSPAATLDTPLPQLPQLPQLPPLPHSHVLDGHPVAARHKNKNSRFCQRALPAVTEDDTTAVRRDSFTDALQPLVLTSEVFLVLPVRARPWTRQARTAVLLVAMTPLVVLSMGRMSTHGMNLPALSPVVFYGVAMLAVYLFSDLCTRWAHLSARWKASGSPLTLTETAATAAVGAVPSGDAKLCWRITATMLACALAEHLLSILADLVPLIHCAEQGGGWVVYKSFFFNKFPMVFEVLPFSVPFSVPLLYVNVICTYLWNVVDILVVVISVLLAGRFRRFNRFLEKAKGKDFSKFWWQEVRESYNRLAMVTKHFDAHINGLVLLSFASNLFFICLQLLHNMTKHNRGDLLAHLYFYFSFAWLLVRAAVVSMSAASVYEQSASPIEVLYCVPSKSFCVEVQRFLVQVTTDTVALTGCRFFWVTRSLILTLVGTVATYEIVLVQFHSADRNRTALTASACSP